jgi:hypothetical protein
LLDHLVVIFLVFSGMPILLSIIPVLTYIPINSVLLRFFFFFGGGGDVFAFFLMTVISTFDVQPIEVLIYSRYQSHVN